MTWINPNQRRDLISRIIRNVVYAQMINIHGPREDDNDWTEEWNDLADTVSTAFFDDRSRYIDIDSVETARQKLPWLTARIDELIIREICITAGQRQEARDSAFADWKKALEPELTKRRKQLRHIAKVANEHYDARWKELSQRADDIRNLQDNQADLNLDLQGELKAIYEQMGWLHEAIKDGEKELAN